MTRPVTADPAASGRLLVAGIGNIFLGDDGFGVEVAHQLATASLPGWVHVADYGIRGMHLAYDLADCYDAAILVDAMQRGGEPGTIYVIEPDRPGAAGQPPDAGHDADVTAALAGSPMLDAHGMQPDVVLRMLSALGADSIQVLVVGCEPARLAHGIGLSEPVAAAVGEAARVVLDLVAGAAGAGQHALVTKEWAHVPGHSR